MPTVKYNNLSQETRQRLLEAAGEVFTERGFRAASVREICKRADVNLASVNYHFGDKDRLYIAVLQYTFKVAAERYPLGQASDSDLPPDRRLHAFIRSYLMQLLDDDKRVWHAKLVAREVADPTSALKIIVNDMVNPVFEALIGIVGDLLRNQSDEEYIRLCAMSILGQCIFYFFNRSVFEFKSPEFVFSLEIIESITDHICRFSLAALSQEQK